MIRWCIQKNWVSVAKISVKDATEKNFLFQWKLNTESALRIARRIGNHRRSSNFALSWCDVDVGNTGIVSIYKTNISGFLTFFPKWNALTASYPPLSSAELWDLPWTNPSASCEAVKYKGRDQLNPCSKYTSTSKRLLLSKYIYIYIYLLYTHISAF